MDTSKPVVAAQPTVPTSLPIVPEKQAPPKIIMINYQPGLHEYDENRIKQKIKRIADKQNSPFIDRELIYDKVYAGLNNVVNREKVNQLLAETAAYMATHHPDYGNLAARFVINDIYKKTKGTFSECVQALYDNMNVITKSHAPLVSDEFYSFVTAHATQLDAMIREDRDDDFDYFGIKTLEGSYLLRTNGNVQERPQYLLLRVSTAIHMPDLERIRETYEYLSQGIVTHATPTLFNAGAPRQQLSSCFLLDMKEDSIDGIYSTLRDCANISKHAGGIGLAIHRVRAQGSYIAGTNGYSNGIVPMLRVFNDSSRYVDQGGGKRKGSVAIYMEPWHADILDFLDLKLNTGKEEQRARDLFYALWVPDLFMQRVESNGTWCLFCPNEAPGLSDVYGEEFERLYSKYESENKYRKRIGAKQLWERILRAQIETGTPYMLYKDACNAKSNQKNLGTLQSSNLCVSGDTLLTTRAGLFEIGTLAGQETEVWNGSEWSRVQVVQTGREQRLIRVVCTGGYDLICTEYHKFVLADGTLCDAKDLSVAQELLFAPQPVVEGSEEMDVESPFLRGFYKTMDDCVLLTRSSVACRVEWINGYCSQAMAPRTHDGWLRLATETGHLELRALLNSLGVFAIEAEGLICVDTAGQRQLESLGVEVGFSEDLPLCEVSPLIVVAKEDPGFYGDTFCFREPKLQRGMFNGILTGNCTEILEYTDNEQTAVCNLASIALNKMVTLERAFDFDKLERATRLLVRNLNRIIDINVYPVYEGERSNKLHRPMGIGVQGLADAFALMKIAFESDEARKLNKDIFETMYYAALSESCALAEREGPYASFEGSPASQGILQFDMWKEASLKDGEGCVVTDRYDWPELKSRIMAKGLRNSLLIALMPTASTAQILGNNESFEPFTSNLYVRRVMAGEFFVINKHLIRDLIERGLWGDAMREALIAAKGSVQGIDMVPGDLKELYKTVWEIKQKALVDLHADRGPFVCQSQSFNVFLQDPTRDVLTSFHYYAWRKGVKTGMYYLRTKPKAQAIAFTAAPPKFGCKSCMG